MKRSRDNTVVRRDPWFAAIKREVKTIARSGCAGPRDVAAVLFRHTRVLNADQLTQLYHMLQTPYTLLPCAHRMSPEACLILVLDSFGDGLYRVATHGSGVGLTVNEQPVENWITELYTAEVNRGISRGDNLGGCYLYALRSAVVPRGGWVAAVERYNAAPMLYTKRIWNGAQLLRYTKTGRRVLVPDVLGLVRSFFVSKPHRDDVLHWPIQLYRDGQIRSPFDM